MTDKPPVALIWAADRLGRLALDFESLLARIDGPPTDNRAEAALAAMVVDVAEALTPVEVDADQLPIRARRAVRSLSGRLATIAGRWGWQEVTGPAGRAFVRQRAEWSERCLERPLLEAALSIAVDSPGPVRSNIMALAAVAEIHGYEPTMPHADAAAKIDELHRLKHQTPIYGTSLPLVEHEDLHEIHRAGRDLAAGIAHLRFGELVDSQNRREAEREASATPATETPPPDGGSAGPVHRLEVSPGRRRAGEHIGYDVIADTLLRQRHVLSSKLVDYMKDRRRASYQDVMDQVHGGERSEGTVRTLVNRTNNRLMEQTVPLRFRTEGGYVLKIIDPE